MLPSWFLKSSKAHLYSAIILKTNMITLRKWKEIFPAIKNTGSQSLRYFRPSKILPTIKSGYFRPSKILLTIKTGYFRPSKILPSVYGKKIRLGDCNKLRAIAWNLFPCPLTFMQYQFCMLTWYNILRDNKWKVFPLFAYDYDELLSKDLNTFSVLILLSFLFFIFFIFCVEQQ